MALDITPTNTGETLYAQSNDALRILWQKGVDMFEQNSDFFAQFEGGRDAPIETKTDLSKGAGQTMIFTIMSGFHSEPKRGSDTFDAPTDFAKINIGTQRLSVDWVRFACRWDERMEDYLGLRGEIVAGLPQELGKLLGRFKTEQVAMMMAHRGNSENYVQADSVADVNALTKDSHISYDLIVEATTKLKTLNGEPAAVGRDGKNVIKKYLVLPITEALMSIELDPSYIAQAALADNRGSENWIYKGGHLSTRGHDFVEWNNIDHDGDGAVGTPWNPKAYLGVAVTAANTAQTLYGGGNSTSAVATGIEYFKWFPGRLYEFILNDKLTNADWPVPFYLVIHNAGVESNPGVSGDAQKWGMYRISANNSGTTLTMNQRLRAAASGIAATQVGDVMWDASVNTDAHPEGALMFLANEKGLPIAKTAVIGKAFARRGYGKHRNTRGDDGHEAGFISEVFIKSVFGQGLRCDRLGRYPGFVMLNHVIKYPHIDTTNAVLASEQ